MNNTVKDILRTVSGIEDTPQGAYNIRVNGESVGRVSTSAIRITVKENGLGIDIHVDPGTVGETVHIPVVVDASGFSDQVYNDFFIGEGSDVSIVAGCGIHNTGHHLSQHDGIHTFYIGKRAKVRYTEKHYGSGGGDGERVLNPVTKIYLDEGARMEMETVQIEGVDDTVRVTSGILQDGASLVVKEKLMTNGKQTAKTTFSIAMEGKDSSVSLSSRSVAKGESAQVFYSVINGNNACAGHSECDAIIMDTGSVKAVPEISANHVDASLIHEAAIGKIAGEQIIKLMTLGLTREEAEAEIINGFLR